jgi:glycosyltransferase involved in cell wall biosynthesis
MPERLIVVADQLPHPPRNGATLPLVNYLAQLGQTHELRLVLLRDADRPFDAAERAENERRHGPLLEATLARRGRLARIADELLGRGLYQHGWAAADTTALARWLAQEPAWRTAPLLASPLSAWARWRAVQAALPEWQPRRHVVVVHDCTAAEYHWRRRSPHPGLGGRLKAWSHWLRAPAVARVEGQLLAGADRVLVQTEADRMAMRRLVGEPVAARTGLAPNGVRPDLLQADAEPATEPRVLFVAELSGEYAPIAEWLCREVWPRVRAQQPGAMLTLVGRGAAPALRRGLAATPGVEHLEFAADLAPLYTRSRVVWSPLWKGFGLINKTLEAMAAARPVVGGRVAFNGIAGFVDGTHGIGLPRPDAAALADATAALLADRPRAGTIGRAARKLVRDGFRWERTAELLREALAEPPAAAPAGVPPLVETTQ